MATLNPTTETRLQIKRTFSAPREKVFHAWTQPEALKKWCAPSEEFSIPTAEVDLRVGGKYRIAMKAPDGSLYVAVGTYREISPSHKLVFTWSWEDGRMPETLVTLEFHDRSGATELVLTHELFPGSEERNRHEQGWMGCLGRLAKLL
jgi:uncharacterized protein YndB with AHSA1/START domain